MKKAVFLLLIFLAVSQTVGFSQIKKGKVVVKADTIAVDSLEHRLIIFDPGFDSWLATQPPKDYYTNTYYAQKNYLYVTEWNNRYLTSGKSGLYDNHIDYNPKIDYGLDINYRLYYYFKFFERTNGIRLIDF